MNFNGLFDGQYHKISNLTCKAVQGNYGSDCGLFDRLYGSVVRLELTGISMTATACIGGDIYGSSNCGEYFYYDGMRVGVQSRDAYGGGICTVNYGTIAGCKVSGSISGSRWFDPGTVPSYAQSDIRSGVVCVGGICGVNEGTIRYCTDSTSLLNITDEDNGTVQYCYAKGNPDYVYQWSPEDVDGTGFSATTAATTTTAMTTTEEITTTTRATTTTAVTTTTTTTTTTDPASVYHIREPEDLVWLSEQDAFNDYAYICLDIDIDMKGVTYKPASKFGGEGRDWYDRDQPTFDGQGYYIRNLHVNTYEWTQDGARTGGLFVESYGVIKDLHLTGLWVQGTSGGGAVFEGGSYEEDGRSWVGGICAYNKGTISGCTVSGKVFAQMSYDRSYAGFDGTQADYECSYFNLKKFDVKDYHISASIDCWGYEIDLFAADGFGDLKDCYAYTMGDVDADGKLGVTDLIGLQKHLLGLEALPAWRAGDVYSDGVLDVYDLAMLKRQLFKKK